ncbi:hypothetical protein ACFVIM_23105 [Streptomyces sp. NPDC057638]|uniref:hypothetical protein n=1 Tax=Streptomyces sp. NPDC057638 TaxID=3346190 RepID=UPI0036B0679C
MGVRNAGRVTVIGAVGAALLAASAAVVLAADPPVNRRISNGREGWESPRWSDERYSKLSFQGCATTSLAGRPKSVTVRYHKDRDWLPDPQYGSRTFTQCFDTPGSVSVGEWRDLPRQHGYYVRIEDINQSAHNTIDVARYSVDTTAAE